MGAGYSSARLGNATVLIKSRILRHEVAHTCFAAWRKDLHLNIYAIMGHQRRGQKTSPNLTIPRYSSQTLHMLIIQWEVGDCEV